MTPGTAVGTLGQGGKRGIGTSDPDMIGYTLPQIRRLLISLIQACSLDPEGVWSWSRWRRRRQCQAGCVTTGSVATHSPKCAAASPAVTPGI
jgi:hypothetical protein